jgi:hypothetical protein
MSEKRAVEKKMLTQAFNGRKPGSPMEWGEVGLRTGLQARRARARKASSPEEAARNSLEEGIALRDAANALKAPSDLIAKAGEAIRPEFRLDFLVDRLKDEPDMIGVIASEHRVELAACVGPRVAESAIDAALTAQAANSLEKMICHQMAAGHRVAMKQLSMTLNETLPMVEIARISNAAARMMQVCQEALLTIHRIRAGGKQTVVVQHVQVSGGGNAVVAGNVSGAPTKSNDPIGGI